MNGGGAEREGDKESEAGSMLTVQSLFGILSLPLSLPLPLLVHSLSQNK